VTRIPGSGRRRSDVRTRLTMTAADKASIEAAAKLQGMKFAPWVVMVVRHEAVRVRLAASSLPHGLHPGARIFRVTSAPAQGAWAYRVAKEASGLERIFVTTFVDDAPSGISPNHRAAVIDVVPNGPKNVVVAADAIRWVNDVDRAWAGEEVVAETPVGG